MILLLKHCVLGHNALEGLMVPFMHSRNAVAIAICATGAHLLHAALVAIHGPGGVFLLMRAQVHLAGGLIVHYCRLRWHHHAR